MSKENEEFSNQYDALRKASLSIIRDLEVNEVVLEPGDALVIKLTEAGEYEVDLEAEADGDGNWLVLHEGFEKLDSDDEVLCVGSEEQNLGIVLTKVGAGTLFAILLAEREYWDEKFE